jgi:peptide/nickel transport system permease protein
VGRYIARRLVLMVVAALGVTLISFIVSRAVPTDPVVSNLGQIASQRPEIVKAFREKWGLDKPFHEQYLALVRNPYHFHQHPPPGGSPTSCRRRSSWPDAIVFRLARSLQHLASSTRQPHRPSRAWSR